MLRVPLRCHCSGGWEGEERGAPVFLLSIPTPSWWQELSSGAISGPPVWPCTSPECVHVPSCSLCIEASAAISPLSPGNQRLPSAPSAGVLLPDGTPQPASPSSPSQQAVSTRRRRLGPESCCISAVSPSAESLLVTPRTAARDRDHAHLPGIRHPLTMHTLPAQLWLLLDTLTMSPLLAAWRTQPLASSACPDPSVPPVGTV